MTVLAHAGHWTSWIFFMVPTLTFIGWLAISTMRERRRLKGKSPDKRD